MERKAEMPNGSFEAEQKSVPLEDITKGPKAVDKTSWGLPRVWKILLLCSFLLCLLLAAVGLYFMKSRLFEASAPATVKVESVTRIIRPVPQPDCRDMLDFLIVYQVQGREVITALRMEAMFQSLLKYEKFKKEPVIFRETVYDFLLRQNAPDNTAKSWRSVFEENLLDYLRIKLPESCPDKIRLTQIENL